MAIGYMEVVNALRIWLIVGLVAALFCIVRGIVDIRQRRYAWGVIGVLVGVALMLAPTPSMSVKVDIPPPTRP